MKPWINVLIIDDDPKYVEILAQDAMLRDINMIYCPYWEEARALISKNPEDYDVIVLDGKGQLSIDSPGGDMDHLKQAQIDLAEMKGRGISIPFVVLTGYVDSEVIAHNIEVFRKGTQEDEAFAKIKELAQTSASYRMRSIYPDIVPLFEDSRLGKTAEAHFLEVLEKVEAPQKSGSDPRNTIRKLLEAFCTAAAKIGIIDQRLAQETGHVNLTSCSIFLSGHEVKYPSRDNPSHHLKINVGVFPDSIASSFQYILKNTHSGSHFKAGDACSHHLAKALFHALGEILSWLNKYGTEHPNPEENRKFIKITNIN